MSPMNNRLLVPRKVPGLLDLVPGAAAAYSLRSLSRSYADPVVTVRRSSDDAEEDFTASEVADGTLAAFCGAGDGFVKQWWDQSGNARHAVAAADTNEPQIVDSGVVILEEGKPAIQFDGSSDALLVGSHIVRLSQNDASVYCVASQDALSANAYLISEADAESPYSSNFILGGGGVVGGAGVLWVNATVIGDGWLGQSLLSFDYDGSLFRAYRNFVQVGAVGATVNSEAFAGTCIGSRADTTQAFFAGKIQEIVSYRSNKSSLRQLIEADIAFWYS